jgi:hypothetical protein
MAKPRILWLLSRTLVLGGLSWIYSRATPPADAACYDSCTSTVDAVSHKCIDAKCNKGKPGQSECEIISGTCGCLFGGSPCNS